MSVVTLIGSGQMASALTFPLFENGHEVRLVGSPLDDEVIDRLREDNYHVNLRRTLHDGINYYKNDAMKEEYRIKHLKRIQKEQLVHSFFGSESLSSNC